MRSKTLKTGTLFSVATLILLLLPAIAAAQTNPTCADSGPFPDGWIISPTSGPPGTMVYISGNPHILDADVFIYTRETGDLYFSQLGIEIDEAFDLIAEVPLETPPGIYDAVLRDNQGQVSYCITFTVTETVRQDAYTVEAITVLPATGLMLLGPLAGFMAMGAGGYIIRKRRL